MESDTAHAICTLILNDIHKGRTYTKGMVSFLYMNDYYTTIRSVKKIAAK